MENYGLSKMGDYYGPAWSDSGGGFFDDWGDGLDIGGALGALKGVGGLLGGGGGARQSTAVSNQTSVSLNPVIANQIGTGGGLSATPGGSAGNTSLPSSSASGNDGYPNQGYYPNAGGWGSNLPAALYGDQTLVPQSLSPATEQSGTGMLVMGALVLGALLLFNS